jgi:uncharacterized iron-regulated protein
VPAPAGRYNRGVDRSCAVERPLSWLRAALLACALALAGCAAPVFVTHAPAPMPDELRLLVAGSPRTAFLLLGEIHDHPLQHRLRAQWLEALAREGRFVIAMEQFDATRQADIDRARAGGKNARGIAEAAGFEFRGWQWDFYAPYVELALRADLPLVAANLSRAQAARIARGEAGAAPVVEPSGWGEPERAMLRAKMRDGHCGMLPESALDPMISAQMARDALMAQVMAKARRDTGLPVVLLAGNGHVRSDLGVPRFLRDLVPHARTRSVGFLEEDALTAAGAYDLRIITPAHPRPDPCAGLERQLRGDVDR